MDVGESLASSQIFTSISDNLYRSLKLRETCLKVVLQLVEYHVFNFCFITFTCTFLKVPFRKTPVEK